MDGPEDLAKGIAENIGYMPIVNKAGEMGSGLMDFLGSLIGGGQAKTPAKGGGGAPPQAPGFLGGLWNAIMSGAQGTGDAFQQDVDRVKGGGPPTGILKDANTAMMMSGTGPAARGLGPGMAKIPATRSVQRVFDPAEGWKEINEVVTPSMDPLKSLLTANPSGFTDMLLKLLQLQRQNTKGSPY
jgi:hypothetical protein